MEVSKGAYVGKLHNSVITTPKLKKKKNNVQELS